jgi:hypothetical protein
VKKPQALKTITRLIIAEDENGVPVAFMGVELETLEMLFIAPEVQEKRVGKRLIRLNGLLIEPGFRVVPGKLEIVLPIASHSPF